LFGVNETEKNKMKIISKSLFLIMLILPLISCGQSFKGRTVLGEQNAKQAIKNALNDKSYKPFYDTLIKEKRLLLLFSNQYYSKSMEKRI
jgi:hypothetical protein